MRIKFYLLSVLCFLLIACDDTLNEVGSSIRPIGDDLRANSAMFELNSKTYLPEAIYLRTPYPLLGELMDDFSKTNIKADYAAQFRAPSDFNLDISGSSDSLDFKFGQDSLLNDNIDSMKIRIMYSTFYGDSIIPMAVTAFELTQELPRNFYSNMSFDGYYKASDPIGTAAYTGIDLNVSDSIRNSKDYVPYVDMMLNENIKNKFFDALKNNPDVFKTEKAFQDFFKGVYFKNTFGSGTMLKVYHTMMGLFYTTVHSVKDSNGQDSTVYRVRSKTIDVVPDVIQLNSLNVTNPSDKILNNDTATFVISPGTYFTEIEIPIGKVIEQLESNKDADAQYLNGFNLNLNAYKPDQYFTQYQPQYMLLVEKDKVNEFFENRSLPDNKTSFVAAFSSDTTKGVYKYNFGNINTLIINAADSLRAKNGSVKESDILTMSVLPVSLRTNSSTGAIQQISNYFLPGGVALWGGKDKKQKASMLYTEKLKE